MFLSVVKQEVSRVSDGHSPKSSVGGLRSLSVLDQSVRDDLLTVEELSVCVRGGSSGTEDSPVAQLLKAPVLDQTAAVSDLIHILKIYIKA